MELLVVMTIMAILTGITLPAVTQTLRAAKLTAAGQMMADELNFARQTAMSRNAPVEVRFYKLPAHNEPPAATPSVYRALQCFVINSGSATPIGKPKYFPAPVIFSQEESESPFLSSTNHPEKDAPDGLSLPGFGNGFKYRSFYFMPGGSAGIGTAENYLTVVLENDPALTQGANFFTIQVNPISGGIRSFRP